MFSGRVIVLIDSNSGNDLALRRDTVLARALELAGIIVSPDEAGKLLPAEKFVDRKTNIAIRLEF